MLFKSHAEAVSYYKSCVNKQKEKIAKELKKLHEFEALMQHNMRLMEQEEAEQYG